MVVVVVAVVVVVVVIVVVLPDKHSPTCAELWRPPIICNQLSPLPFRLVT